MTELVPALLAYPTGVFTVVIGLVAAYWLLVIVGAADLDHGGGHDGALDALAAKGEAAGSAVDALAAKGEAVGGAIDAAASNGDAAGGLFDGDAGIDDVGVLASAVNLRRAPITITATFLAIFGWIASFCAMRYLAPLAEQLAPAWLVGTLVFAGSLGVAVPLTSLATRPFESIFKTTEGRRRRELVGSVCRIRTGGVAVPLTSLATRPFESIFKTTEGRRRRELVGSVCRIRTGGVGAGFGQATLNDEGAELVIPVRIELCDGEPVTLARGDAAMIIDYDEERSAYVVEPYEALVGDGRSESPTTNRGAE